MAEAFCQARNAVNEWCARDAMPNCEKLIVETTDVVLHRLGTKRTLGSHFTLTIWTLGTAA